MLALSQLHATPAMAKEFDVTGTLDCGVRSGDKCQFVDWETGPKLAVFTEDISGTRERWEIDASWIRDDLMKFGQDDFVWFTVRDEGSNVLRATGVVEHRCNDGRIPHGQASHGRSTGSVCRLEQE